MIAAALVGGSGAQCGVKSQIGNFVFGRDTGADVVAPLTFGFGLGTTSRLLTGQFVELGVQPTRGEFLGRLDFLPAFPPISFLREVGYGLGAGLGLSGLGPFAGFRV